MARTAWRFSVSATGIVLVFIFVMLDKGGLEPAKLLEVGPNPREHVELLRSRGGVWGVRGDDDDISEVVRHILTRTTHNHTESMF